LERGRLIIICEDVRGRVGNKSKKREKSLQGRIKGSPAGEVGKIPFYKTKKRQRE